MIVQISDGMDSSMSVIRITINALPSVPVISGASYVCNHGGTTTLTGIPSGGIWHSADGNTTINASGVVTGIGGGPSLIAYISAPNSYGCRSAALDTITVLGIPSAGYLTGAPTICLGSSTTLTASVSGGSWNSYNTSIATVTSGGSITGVTTGNVYIAYTVNNGCFSAIATRQISVNGATTLPGIGGLPYVRIGSFITLSDALAGGSWSCTNTSLASVSSIGVLSGLLAGIDTVIYSYTNGCGITSSVSRQIRVLAARGEETDDALMNNVSAVTFNVFPNPTSGIITIELAGAAGNTDVEVYDIMGKQLIAAASESSKLELDLSQIASGIYLIRASNAGSTYIRRIVIVR